MLWLRRKCIGVQHGRQQKLVGAAVATLLLLGYLGLQPTAKKKARSHLPDPRIELGQQQEAVSSLIEEAENRKRVPTEQSDGDQTRAARLASELAAFDAAEPAKGSKAKAVSPRKPQVAKAAKVSKRKQVLDRLLETDAHRKKRLMKELRAIEAEEAKSMGGETKQLLAKARKKSQVLAVPEDKKEDKHEAKAELEHRSDEKAEKALHEADTETGAAGAIHLTADGDSAQVHELANDHISLKYKVLDGAKRSHLQLFAAKNKMIDGALSMPLLKEVLVMYTATLSGEHRHLNSSWCQVEEIKHPGAIYPRSVSATLYCPLFQEKALKSDKSMTVHWSATIASEDSLYIRGEVGWFLAHGGDSNQNVITEYPMHVVVLSTPAASIVSAGSAMGTPFYDSDHSLYFALESPLSTNGVLQNVQSKAVCASTYCEPVVPGLENMRAESFVIGAFQEKSQRRRNFNSYINDTRAHPPRPFLHYNSWFDFASWQEPNAALAYRHMAEPICIDRVQTFGKELVGKRGVQMDSFLWDDGWDNQTSLWKFHKERFPRGFSEISKEANKFHIGTGVWVSPWGGYGPAKDARIESAKKDGYETHVMDNSGVGFSLSGPKYAKRFREIMLDMVRRYNVNMFKVDGIGFEGNHTQIKMEVEGMFQLMKQLRIEGREDLFLSMTTGTWPSPYWLHHGDSIWRGHGDIGMEGRGSNRMRWLLFRDAVVYYLVVQKSPWYPLSGLMLHGIILGAVGQARYAGLDRLVVPGNAAKSAELLAEFEHEVWSYFGMGVSLQELYLSPDLMTSEAWDIVAKAAKWARANNHVLQDSRWIGGDPLTPKATYGFASWSPTASKGIALLKNPTLNRPHLNLRLSDMFELPNSRKKGKFRLKLVYGGGAEAIASIASIFTQKGALEGEDAIFCHGEGAEMTCDLDATGTYNVAVPPRTLVLFEAVETQQ